MLRVRGPLTVPLMALICLGFFFVSVIRTSAARRSRTVQRPKRQDTRFTVPRRIRRYCGPTLLFYSTASRSARAALYTRAMTTPGDVLHFWFEEAGPKRWFRQSESFDDLCRQRFLPALESAARGECWSWRDTPAGRCAEIIVLDQFSRNLFRGSARSFSQDGMALVLAQEAVAAGADQRMTDEQRYFAYMPYMHAESLIVHDEALRLFTALGNAEALRYEKAHRDVIERFGRYPARNAILGRESTAEEMVYLENNRGF